MTGLLDRFKKDDGGYGGGMVEERPPAEAHPGKDPAGASSYGGSGAELGPGERIGNPPGYASSVSEPSSDIGIDSLMNKRVKLEEAIDYVGLMIKNLKDKRTRLEKEIEDESVDIRNLREKLAKVREYIDEENKGIEDLAQKRARVEGEADEVGSIVGDLKDRLSEIDGIVNAEGDRIKSFKESRPKLG